MVTVLLVIVGGGMVTTFLMGQTAYFSTDASIQVQQEARRAFDAMNRELREAGPTTGATLISTTGANQLNFQIARGYNTEPGVPPTGCQSPLPTICWGSEQATGQWVHYAVVGPPGNQRQLIRCTNTSQGTPITMFTPGTCRVLANNIMTDPTVPVFTLDSLASPKVVKIQLLLQYKHSELPGGAQTFGTKITPGTNTSPLISQVRLRNS